MAFDKQHTFPFTIAIVIAYITFDCTATAQDNNYPLASNGLFGTNNVGIIITEKRLATLSAHTGYGFVEPFDTVETPHHSIRTGIGLGLYPLSWMAFGIDAKGRIDFQSTEDQRMDRTVIGDPYLTLRIGEAINEWVRMAGQIRLWVPGQNIPSLQWNATTLDFVHISTFLSRYSVSISTQLGYRLDNSGKAAPPVLSLRSGDRISLNLSDYHAVIAGIGIVKKWNSVSAFVEYSSDILVGKNAPTRNSPVRISSGITFHPISQIQLGINAQISLSKRLALDNNEIMPIEPRFTALITGGYIFDFKKKSAQKEISPIRNSQIMGYVTDESYKPIVGATISAKTTNGINESFTSLSGNFNLQDVPYGIAAITIEASNFEPITVPLDVNTPQMVVPTIVLNKRKLTSQLKGYIRNTQGAPLAAKVSIHPGGDRLQATPKGTFKTELEPALYTVTISMKGFLSHQQQINVGVNNVVILNVEMHPRE